MGRRLTPGTAPFPDEALEQAVLNLVPEGAQRTGWWVEYQGEGQLFAKTRIYCDPCHDRVHARLYPAASETDAYRWGQEDDERDSPQTCDYCGHLLDVSLSRSGVADELDHFEALTDTEIARANAAEIARLTRGLSMDSWDGQNTDLTERTRETLLRYLRSRGTPFDPTRHAC